MSEDLQNYFQLTRKEKRHLSKRNPWHYFDEWDSPQLDAYAMLSVKDVFAEDRRAHLQDAFNFLKKDCKRRRRKGLYPYDITTEVLSLQPEKPTGKKALLTPSEIEELDDPTYAPSHSRSDRATTRNRKRKQQSNDAPIIPSVLNPVVVLERLDVKIRLTQAVRGIISDQEAGPSHGQRFPQQPVADTNNSPHRLFVDDAGDIRPHELVGMPHVGMEGNLCPIDNGDGAAQSPNVEDPLHEHVGSVQEEVLSPGSLHGESSGRPLAPTPEHHPGSSTQDDLSDGSSPHAQKTALSVESSPVGAPIHLASTDCDFIESDSDLEITYEDFIWPR